MSKAIVILEGEALPKAGRGTRPNDDHDRNAHSFAGIELLGSSVVDRVLDQLNGEGIEAILVSTERDRKGDPHADLSVGPENCWSIAGRHLDELGAAGEHSALVMRIGSYAEINAAQFLEFRAETGESVTRAFKGETALEIWAVDPSRLAEMANASGNSLQSVLLGRSSPYEIEGYVNPLSSPRDVRTLVGDALNGRCAFRPLGFEVRPGVWMAEGAEVENEARIVAPAFIGRDVTISRQCLITRGSNIERDSLIDYGTVIEDTSILPNTYVGIGLDVSHSIVDGETLLNLQHGVVLQVEDSAVMRRNKVLGRSERSGWWVGLRTRERVQAPVDEGAA